MRKNFHAEICRKLTFMAGQQVGLKKIEKVSESK
jgi:hypothetical protein